jgi:hypothetical protein
MSKKKNSTPVIGGCNIPTLLLDSPDQIGAPPDDDLGRQVFWLLNSHPEIDLQFRDQDLNAMDDATKQQLLSDINAVLGIQPLRTTSL